MVELRVNTVHTRLSLAFTPFIHQGGLGISLHIHFVTLKIHKRTQGRENLEIRTI